MKNLRKDLDNERDESRNLRDKNDVNEATRYQLESKLRDRDVELQQTQLNLNGLEGTNQVRLSHM